MFDYLGYVVHIAEGTYEGTIAWQHNPAASVSSHFVLAKDGRVAQCVDTDIRAWTQVEGNGHVISGETEGFSGDSLTPEQIEAHAQLFARGHLEYGYPLKMMTNSGDTGLGYHALGGVAWGNHPNCPGSPIIAQLPLILARAIEIVGEDLTAEDIWRWVPPDQPEIGFPNPYGFNMYQIVMGSNSADWEDVNLDKAQSAKLDEIAAKLDDGVTLPVEAGLTDASVDKIVDEFRERLTA